MPSPILSRQALSCIIPALTLALAMNVAAPVYAAAPLITAPVLPEPLQLADNPKPTALQPEELGTIHAGADTHIDVITAQDLTAVNSGNAISADSVSSGSINITSGALQGYNGVGNFVMNTGHNNNLQGTISVTVTNTADLPRQ